MAVPYTVIDPTKPPQKPGDPLQPMPYTPPASGDLSQGWAENHFSQDQALKGAGSGALQGAKFGGIGAGYGAAAGAIMGALKGRTNNTKNERETFAQSLGVPDTTALWQKLSQALPADQAAELQSRALSRIGKHDTTANQQWEQDVQAALSASGLNASQQAQQQPAVAQGGGGMDPSRQGVLDALKGGGNYRDALVAYLAGRGR